MKIIKLQAENVKRLSAVEIQPDGSLVVIGGRHGNGKSSVLDSIMYALGGNDTLPPRPLRNGTDKGHVTLTLDDLIVTRRFSRKKGSDDVTTSLEIKRANGDKVASPQALLDSLCGKLAFDPLEFSRLKPKSQLESLKELVNLDFTDLDNKRARIFERRTDINRQAKAKSAELAACPVVPGVPAEEVSVAELAAKIEEARSHNAINDGERRELEDCRRASAVRKSGRQVAQEKVETLKRQLAEAESAVARHEQEEQAAIEAEAAQREKVAALKDIDTSDITAQISAAETTNRGVRQNAKRSTLAQSIADLEADSDDLTKQIEQIDAEKGSALKAAKFPVDGLSFGENGVLLHGLPLEQACTKDQIELSVAMGIAMNPKLRVMLIREGSMLFADETGLGLIAKLADEAGAQVWIERASLGEECSVILEDGMVKAETPELAGV